jgi:hypothetical protein
MSQQKTATLQQIKKVSQLGGSALVREFGKLAKLDKRFDLDSDVEIKDQLMSVISELESDFAIDNNSNNETVNNQVKTKTEHDSTPYLELATYLIEGKRTHTTANDQTVEVTPTVEINEPIGTGLAGHNKTELFYWPQYERYCVKPYDKLLSLTKDDWAKFSFNFHKLTDFPKNVIAKAAKLAEVKPTKYYAQYVVNFSFESLDDLNGKQFDSPDDLIKFLTEGGIEYDNTDTEMLTVKRLQSQRSVGTTGNTKGGLSDPFERLDPSVPVESDRIKAVKKGSSAHLALLALQQGINIKDKSEAAIASLQSLADSNNCEMINPEQFSWKFRQASLMNGYGYELTAPNTYKLVMPEGLDTIKVK